MKEGGGQWVWLFRVLNMTEKEAKGFVKIPQGSELRHVEKDALVGKIMQKRAKELCSDYVKRKLCS